MKLSDYAFDEYSQFGEDGMVEEIFNRIGEESRVCVEFGAADGNSCSNTKKLWKNGWEAHLIEGDTNLFQLLQKTTEAVKECYVYQGMVQPEGNQSIDNFLLHIDKPIDFMSIDVDGADYLIWKHMQLKPRVICIEYNESIPPHISLYQSNVHGYVGSSAKAFVELAKDKGYFLIGMNKANLFFVSTAEYGPFGTLETELNQLFPYEDLAYVSTSYSGRPFIVGTPPWGVSDDYFVDELSGDDIYIIGSTANIVAALEAKYRKSVCFVGQNWDCAPSQKTDIGIASYERVFKDSPYELVVVDVANQRLDDPNMGDWVIDIGKENDYSFQRIKNLFVFIRKETIDE